MTNHDNGQIATTIVIPTVESPTLDRTLRAVGRNIGDRVDVEVLVVGLDESNYRAALPAARYVTTQRRVYPGAARNLGAQNARGKRLVFIDADCLPCLGWLDRIEARLAHERCAVGGGVAFEREGYWARADNVALLHEFLSTRPAHRRRYLPSLNFAIHRDDFLSLGGFDETLRSAEDLDLTARLTRAGVPLYFLPDAVVVHRPVRRSVLDLWRHHFLYGENSARVRLRYPDVMAAPFILRSGALMTLLAPIVASATTARIFITEPWTRPYWATAPGIFAAKLAWCWSVARASGRRQ